MRVRPVFTVVAALAVLTFAGPAAAHPRPPVLHQVGVPAVGGSTVDSIDVSPGGTVWFSVGDAAVWRIGAGGRPEVVATLGEGEHVLSLVAAPDGNAWLAVRGA